VQQVPLWHVSFVAQVPHMSVPPQPSLTVPHAFAGHARGVHAVQTLFVHVWPIGHAPQLTVPVPHPLPIVPQLCAPHAVGIPHTPGTPPPPHVSGAVHAAQVTCPPHPSAIVPQSGSLFGPTHVDGVQLHVCEVALHVPDEQAPHDSVPPHPSGRVPQ